MANDLEQRMSFEEEAKNLIGVPECLIHMERRMVLHGAGRVDNPYAISANLTGYVRPKAHCLVVHFRKEGDVLKRPGYGQVGFIRKDKIQTSPGGTEDFSVVPVTAKHNLRCMDGGKLNAVQAEARIGERHTADFAFDDLNWMSSTTDSVTIRSDGNKELRVRSATWTYGVDISKGNLVANPTEGVTSEHSSFALVRDTFHLEVGQKVGMAVLFTPQGKPTRQTVASVGVQEVDISDSELERIYGQPNSVNLYTGLITYVGDDHIEYDINTFTGCSGATVFLLDQGQPPSVQQCDYGRAVAVHAGAHPFMATRNLGFKILRAFE